MNDFARDTAKAVHRAAPRRTPAASTPGAVVPERQPHGSTLPAYARAARPALPAAAPALPDTDPDLDPEATLPPAQARRWRTVYEDLQRLRGALGDAELAAPSVTRMRWLAQLHAPWLALGAVRDAAALDAAERAYRQLEQQVYDAGTAAGEDWLTLRERSEAELARLAGPGSLAAALALEHLAALHRETAARVDRIGLDLLMPDDLQPLRTALDGDGHLWQAELQAARLRAAELRQMLDVVGALRGRGQDADRAVPGWNARVTQEDLHLRVLVAQAPGPTQRIGFEALRHELLRQRDAARDRRPRSKGLLEKGFDLAHGALSSVVEPIIEAGRQLVDLGQIGWHFVGGTRYEPDFISAVGKAAEGGAGTGDLLWGMAQNLYQTPERFWKAIQDDDWEAIGREGLNLIQLAKMGRAGAARAAPWLALQRARRAGLRGGISPEAAVVVRRVAMKTGMVFRFRQVDPVVLRHRAAGLPPKPEALKMKTIGELDLHLGAQAADIGKVGYFEPRIARDLSHLPAGLRAQVMKRYAERRLEWQTEAPKVAQLVAKGKIEIDGQVVHDAATGRAFTGDYDLFDIRQGSMQGPGVEYPSLPARARRRLEADPVAVQHGAHLDWVPDAGGGVAGFGAIVRKVRPGGETMVEFHPDGSIRYGHFDD